MLKNIFTDCIISAIDNTAAQKGVERVVFGFDSLVEACATTISSFKTKLATSHDSNILHVLNWEAESAMRASARVAWLHNFEAHVGMLLERDGMMPLGALRSVIATSLTTITETLCTRSLYEHSTSSISRLRREHEVEATQWALEQLKSWERTFERAVTMEERNALEDAALAKLEVGMTVQWERADGTTVHGRIRSLNAGNRRVVVR